MYKNVGLHCVGRLRKHIYISGRAKYFIPLLSLDIFLAHPEARKTEFNNNSIYGFSGIFTLTFKMPESKSRSCLWWAAICIKNLYL
jgi:hypothetical protein